MRTVPKASSSGAATEGSTPNDGKAQHSDVLFSRHSLEKSRFSRLQRLSLRTKATAFAVAIGTIPVFVIGSTAYYVASRSEIEQANQAQQARATDLADELSRLMFDRFGDIQIMASLPAFRDPKLRQVATLQEKQAALERFVSAYKIYDSVAVFDLNGNAIAKSKGELGRNAQGQITNNIKDRDHFQEALKTDRSVISRPNVSKTTGKVSLFMAAPVKDSITGKTIAIARARIPIDALEAQIKNYGTGGNEYHLVDSTGKFFMAAEKEQVGRNAPADFPGLAEMKVLGKIDSRVFVDRIDNAEQLISYAPLERIPGLPDIGWDILMATDTAIAFAAQRQLLTTLLLGTGLTAVLVGAIAAYLARRATQPIENAADAVEKLGQGDLDIRIAVAGQDEVAKLGNNINRMAGQIQTLLTEQQESARQQLAAQAEVARQQEAAAHQQAESAEQQRLAKESLQRRALELLIEVDPVSRGDLTIRAKVTEDEIGTVADSYNATISSLRQIVAQVQAAARQMSETTSSSEVSVQGLSAEALRQTEEITIALDQIQAMNNSIQAVASSAAQAETAVREATQTVNEGDAAMNRTVVGILAIQETVAETSEKVKRLGESSQEISKVVNLINTFADQTNLLALNASIEAARAGEEGRGFGVVADEVRALALQSAEATAEIARIVDEIQVGTNEVIAAMETGNEQVVMGTKLVDETRQSLNKITAVSSQISTLVEAIGQAAIAQSQASESVTHTMNDVAAISNKTSTEATQVSTSFKNLLTVAQELQTSAGQFKVS